jgi:hypothetical protein
MATVFETIQNNDLLKIVLILGALYLFMNFYKRENLDNIVPVSSAVVGGNYTGLAPSTPVLSDEQIVSSDSKLVARPVIPDIGTQDFIAQADKLAAGGEQLSTKDLLPKYDAANDFAKENPVGKLLQETNFLQSGFHAGINTHVESNKIAYLDLRSMPPIAKQQVGPFLNSSYEQSPGAKRRFMEIL